MNEKALSTMHDYPESKDFIFTIFDDTDVATLDYIMPIYDLLSSLNIRTTKSVWPLKCNDKSPYEGSHTLEDPAYADYIRELAGRGFEIGFHGPTMTSSGRENIQRSLEVFHNVVGHYPRIYAPHSLNRENLYWGSSRFTFAPLGTIYSILSKEDREFYQGHIEGSPFFWGDLSLQFIDYVRSFTFNNVNLLNISRMLPYHNSRLPWVKSFFFTSDADNVEEFNLFLSEENQSKLEQQRGVCIISTHFGKGFLRNGRVHPRTKELLSRLAEKNGWFVPVSTALDFLKSRSATTEMGAGHLFSLELRWFVHAMIRQKNAREYDRTEKDYLFRRR